MGRLPNKGTTQRAPQTGASVPELPDFSPQLAELPGGQETNAAMQRWWDLVRQRIEFTDVGINGRMQTFTKTIDGITGSITVLEEITSDVEDYLESRYTLNVTAGDVATGITVFSRTGPDTNISYIAFQADRFLVNTASGNKQIFSVSATEAKLGNVLTVDLANSRLYMGTGTYANANTYFYVDTVSGGRMSLGSKFVWDGANLTLSGTITATAGSIGGWDINASTLSKNNAILDSTGQLVLGTSNDVVYLSATNATYRLWVGNATAGTAAFSVTKAGALFSISGLIGGFTIASNNLSATGTGGYMEMSAASGQLLFSDGPNYVTFMSATDGLSMMAPAATQMIVVRRSAETFARWEIDTSGIMVWGSGAGAGDTNLYRSGANQLSTDDTFNAFRFSGDGQFITALNATEITSGTLNTARLPSTINISTAYQISGTQVVTSQQAVVANAGTSSNVDATYNKAQLDSVFNAFGSKINEVLTRLRSHGLIAT